MAEEKEEKQDGTQLSRSETVTAIAHYYRAEVTRSLAWRERLDRTTNWAVGATAAFLGFAFSHPEIHHSLFFFAVAIVYTLLFVEARRYRFYDAYEYRVRLLHQHFIYNVLAKGELAGEMDSDSGVYWRAELASDIRYPQYKMGFPQALGRRFFANYIFLFGILFAGWLVKIQLHPTPSHSWDQFVDQASFGNIPGWVTFLFMAAFAAHTVVLVRIGRHPRGGRDVSSSRKCPR